MATLPARRAGSRVDARRASSGSRRVVDEPALAGAVSTVCRFCTRAAVAALDSVAPVRGLRRLAATVDGRNGGAASAHTLDRAIERGFSRPPTSYGPRQAAGTDFRRWLAS